MIKPNIIGQERCLKRITANNGAKDVKSVKRRTEASVVRTGRSAFHAEFAGVDSSAHQAFPSVGFY